MLHFFLLLQVLVINNLITCTYIKTQCHFIAIIIVIIILLSFIIIIIIIIIIIYCNEHPKEGQSILFILPGVFFCKLFECHLERS